MMPESQALHFQKQIWIRAIRHPLCRFAQLADTWKVAMFRRRYVSDNLKVKMWWPLAILRVISYLCKNLPTRKRLALAKLLQAVSGEVPVQ